MPYRRSLILSLIAIIGLGVDSPSEATPPLFDSPQRGYHTGDQVVNEAYRPKGIAMADLDEDGDLDIVLAHVGNFIAPRFNILWNDGDGSYDSRSIYPTSGETYNVVIADLDGDLDLDLAFTQSDQGVNSGQSVLVFLNSGGGTFGPELGFPVGRGPKGITAADFDHDGDIDLAVANNRPGEGDISVLYNDGAAGFLTRVDVPVPGGEPYQVEAGDLDADGWADVVVSLSDAPIPIGVFQNDGTGTILPGVMYAVGVFPGLFPGLALGDIDNDNDLDIVYQGDAVLRNSGGGIFNPPETIPGGLFGIDIELVDVTGDGFLDIIGARVASMKGWLLRVNNGAGGFTGTYTETFRSGENAETISVGDVDGDSDPDVVAANPGALTVSVHTNEGGVFEMPYMTPTLGSVMEIDVADLDLDGDVDIASPAYRIEFHWNNGDGTFNKTDMSPLLGRLHQIKLRDINGDLYPDILFLKHRSSPSYDLYTSLNNGDGTFGAPTRWPLNSCGTGDLETVDLDNDGDLDVVMTEYLGCPGSDNRKLYVLESNGDGTFEPVTLVSRSDITRAERVIGGDFNRDGNQDIVTTHPQTVAFWPGNGDGTFGAPIESNLVEWGPKFIVTADFNGDDILDLATANYGSNFRGESMNVMLGNGDGSFSPNGVYFSMFSLSYGGVGGIDVLDADSDGDVDIICGAYGGSDVVLFLNNGSGSFQPQQRYGVGGEVHFVRAADFNGDGVADVAANFRMTAGGQDGISILKGTSTATGVEVRSFDVPTAGRSRLGQNAPNPFNPVTRIDFVVGSDGVSATSVVQIDVFDIRGRHVDKLVDEQLPQGRYQVVWNAGNSPSGVYFYQLRAEGITEVKKMTLVR